ncbi:hypothetical protein CAP35_12510 [Chitinophagaceae bacterium IBVUCB1]|nr:hypothetical protein CAP35_12510 [Chitinophagaceae bacterium IBVUCB1]
MVIETEIKDVLFNYPVTFEDVDNEILSETFYIVTWNHSEPFIMAWDFDEWQLVIQSKAPHMAKLFEYALFKVIDDYNNGFCNFQ